MTEQQATAVADALDADAWQSGGGIWLVLKRRADGRLAVLSDEVVCEYESASAFEGNRPAFAIQLH